MVLFMRVSENLNQAGYHGIVAQYWSFMFWPYCIMELLPKMYEKQKAIQKQAVRKTNLKQMRKGAML